MDTKRFWEIIEQAKAKAGGDWESRPEQLRSILEKLTPEELISFDQQFQHKMAESYLQKLWAAAYLLNGGCSDDGFDYFRMWLISEGQEHFEKALEDPDSLAEFATPEVELEEYSYVAREVYEEKTGEEEMPDYERMPYELKGDEWKEEELEEMFPEIAALVSEDEE